MRFSWLMLSTILCADVMRLIGLAKASKRTKRFTVFEKVYSVVQIIVFLAGFLWFALESCTFGCVVCVLGFVTSELATSITFYEHFKDLEIPYE